MAVKLFDGHRVLTLDEHITSEDIVFGGATKAGSWIMNSRLFINQVRGHHSTGLIDSSYTAITSPEWGSWFELECVSILLQNLANPITLRIGTSAGGQEILADIDITEHTKLSLITNPMYLGVYIRIIGANSATVYPKWNVLQ